MKLIRILGYNQKITIKELKVIRFSKTGKIFFEVEEALRHMISFESIGQFKQVKGLLSAFELFTTPAQFKTDYSRFIKLYNTQLFRAPWFTKSEKVLINDWYLFSIENGKDWLEITTENVSSFICNYKGDSSSYKLSVDLDSFYRENIPKLKLHLNEQGYFKKKYGFWNISFFKKNKK